MDTVTIVLVLVIALALAFWIWDASSKKKTSDDISTKLSEWPDFEGRRTLMKVSGDQAWPNGISLDFERHKAIIIGGQSIFHSTEKLNEIIATRREQTTLPAEAAIKIGDHDAVFAGSGDKVAVMMELSASDILEVDVISDGKTVTKTSRGSQIIGTVVGGALLGGIGALIGGLSAESQSTPMTVGVKLRLLLKNVTYPVHIIDFSEYSPSTSKALFLPEVHGPEAVEWAGLIKNFIGVSDETDDASTEKPSVSHDDVSSSLASQVRQLAELREQGVLSDEEFKSAKKKLMT